MRRRAAGSATCTSCRVGIQALSSFRLKLQELLAPFYYDRKGEVKAGEAGYFGRPVLNFYQ